MPNRLSKFTPAGLDTGALLYEAGRASVPSPWRAWAFVGLLCLTQTLTLATLMMPARGTPAADAPMRSTPGADAPGSPGPGAMHVRRLPDEPPGDDLPPDGPILRAIDLSTFD